MKRFLTLVLFMTTFQANADQNENSYFICVKNIDNCPDLQKGDVLRHMDFVSLSLYCDKNKPIIISQNSSSNVCIYNGQPIKPVVSLPRNIQK